MILLDTHIWVWWINDDPRLLADDLNLIKTESVTGLHVSVISCWEVSRLISLNRFGLTVSAKDWIEKATRRPVYLLPLSPEVAIESNYLPGKFHKDPADQIIVATARVYNMPLMTRDRLIRAYPHVQTLP